MKNVLCAVRTVRFDEVPVGGRFEFRGRRFEKIELSVARDEERWGAVFHEETEVVEDFVSAMSAHECA